MRRYCQSTLPVIICTLLLLIATLSSVPAAHAGWRFTNSIAKQNLLSAMGMTYYVAPDGDDGSSGTRAAPFRTLGKAASMVQPGDTVLVRGGQYNERVVIYASGTANARITFAAYTGEEPVIDGSGLPLTKDGGLVEIGEPVNKDMPPLDDTGNYVTFKGFTVQNSSGRGISVAGDNVELFNNRITQTQQSGVIARKTSNSTFSGNFIWNTVRVNAAHTSTSGWPPALSVWESTDVTITDNTIHDNHGEGISTWKGTSRMYISTNRLYDNWSINLYLDNASDSVVEHNVIYETDTAYISRYDNDGTENPRWREIAAGIAVADENYTSLDSSYTCNAHNNTIRNNVIVNVRFGFTFYRYIACSSLQSLLFDSNTIVDTWDYAVRVYAGNHDNSVFRNNIMYPKAGIAILVDTPGNTRFENNLLYNPNGTSSDMFQWQGKRYNFAEWQAQTNVTNNTWTDPLLVKHGVLNTQILPTISQGADRSVIDDYVNNVDGRDDGMAGYRNDATEHMASASAESLATSTPPSPDKAITLPGRIEAEDYIADDEGMGYHDTTAGNRGGAYRQDDVDIEACSDGSGCYNVGWTVAGEWLKYDVHVAQSGSYTFNARVASRYNSKQITIEVAGQTVSLAVPKTGTWQNWTLVQSAPMTLPAGTYALRIISTTGDVNINYVDIQRT